MKIKAFLALLFCTLLLTVCSCAETIVTSFYPIYIFTTNLTEGIDGMTVHNLAAPGTGCLHDYQLQTGDMKTLAAADVFVINGAGMESYLSMITESLPELPIIDSSVGIELLTEENEPVTEQTPADEHLNAHIWLDAENAMQMVRNICEGLILCYPQHQEILEANRDEYLGRLQALDAAMEAGTAGLSRREIITFHEAFPYFARAYGLTVAAVVNEEPGESISPAKLRALVETVRSLNNPPLFTEPQYSDVIAKTVSDETGAPIYSLDPIVTGPEGHQALTYYEEKMYANLSTLQTALH